MSSRQQNRVLLDEWHLDFIQHHVTINLSSRDANNMPTLARGFGCRILDDGKKIAVYIPGKSAHRLLQSVAGHGMIAAVFSRPTTHQALQLKGSDARVVVLDSEDRRVMHESFETFLDDVKVVGFPERFIDALRAMFAEEAVAVTFTPNAAFLQTPGPQAGQSLATSS